MNKLCKQKVCLIGTSNGVFSDGYSSVFAESENFSLFSNFSLGYSSSYLFSLKISGINLLSYDICILEFSVNDGVNLSKNIITEDNISSVISDSIRKILQSECMPAILILPVLSLYQNNDRRISKIYLDLAKKYKILLFDSYAYLDFCKERGVDIPSLFEDDMHIKRDFSRKIAKYFMEGLTVLPILSNGEEILDGDEFSYEYLEVGSLNLPHLRKIKRGTRLYATETLEISEVTAIALPTYQGSELVGFGVDWANTCGRLFIDGGTKFEYDFTTPYSSLGGNSFVFGVHPLFPTIKLERAFIYFGFNDSTLPSQDKITIGGLVYRYKIKYSIRLRLDKPFIISNAFIRPLQGLQYRVNHDWDFSYKYFDSLFSFSSIESISTGVFTIKVMDIFYDFLVIDKKSPVTVFYFHSSLPKGPSLHLPAFDIIPEYDANLVLISDPSLYFEPNLDNGWFSELSGRPLQELLKYFISSFANSMVSNRLIFLGIDSGGDAALFYASKFSDSFCISIVSQDINLKCVDVPSESYLIDSHQHCIESVQHLVYWDPKSFFGFFICSYFNSDEPADFFTRDISILKKILQ